MPRTNDSPQKTDTEVELASSPRTARRPINGALPSNPKQTSGKRSRRKGIGFEREVVQVFADVFGADHVKRGIQFRGGGEAPDVHTPVFWIECKRGKRVNILGAMKQAANGAKTAKLGVGSDTSVGMAVPAVVAKVDREEATLTMPLAMAVCILKQWWERYGVDAGK